MRYNGFTLIELLAVVAIIGVLAAVGVVAFNGFINSAKVNTMKANQKAIVSYFQSELQKCNLGMRQSLKNIGQMLALSWESKTSLQSPA